MTAGWNIPPARDEIEISLFGPGFGESLAIHLGARQWIIVDSCVDKGIPDPIPIHYLKNIGVDVTTEVSHVVASHWHDDHVRGLSQIVEQCTQARFVCASAMMSDKFQLLGELYSTPPSAPRSGIDNFAKVHMVVDAQRKTVVRAGPNRQFINRLGAPLGLHYDVKLFSLSPSDEAAEAAVRNLASSLSAKIPVKRLANLLPNDFSIVLQLMAGQDSFLFGSDMETHAKYGWRAILASEGKPTETSLAFKVAHHGADSGHDDEVWAKMLQPNPYAIMTPFVRGGVRLPTSTDIARIRRLTVNAFITADPSVAPKRQYRPSVQRTIRESGFRITPVSTSWGHIRFRRIPGTTTSNPPELFNGARAL